MAEEKTTKIGNVEAIGQMSVLELSELVSQMEDKFGVSASAVMAVSSGTNEETYDLWLKSFGDNMVKAIKAVRMITGLGLMEAKRLVESAPVIIKESVPKQEAEDIIELFKSHGVLVSTTQNTDDLLVPAKDIVLENSLLETQLDLLACQTMGLNPDEFPVSRIIPINIYLASGECSDEILSAVSDFLNVFELEVAGESPAVISSFFKRLWAKTTSKETLDELNNKLKKMEDALVAQQIDKPKSEIDLNHAIAAEKLLNALGKESKSTALHVGNLLVLVLVDENGDKHDRVVTLTKEQVEMIQRDQSLLRKPELLLQYLNPKTRKISPE